MADVREFPERMTRRAVARAAAVHLGLVIAWCAVVLVVQEVVYRVSGWDRLWILLVLVPIGWAGITVAQRWLDRRFVQPRTQARPGRAEDLLLRR